MAFRDNLHRICREQNTNLSRLMVECGVSTSKVSAINQGSLPKEDMLLKFANHLNCSVMDFFMDEEDISYYEKIKNLQHLEPDEDLDDVIRIYKSLSRRQKHDFMSMVYKFEEDINNESSNLC